MVKILDYVKTQLRGNSVAVQHDTQAPDETERRLIRTAESVFTDANEITLDSTKDDVIGWDSVGNLQLLLALEEEFDIEFDQEELQRADSLYNIYEICKKRRKIHD